MSATTKPRGQPAPVKRTAARSSRSKTASAAHQTVRVEVLRKFREVFSAVRFHFDEVSKQLGVTGTELWAMWELQQNPSQRVSDLAARLSVRQSTVSNLIERLENLGLATRVREDADRRVVRLKLTAEGRKTLRRAPAPARGVLPDALEQLTQADLERLRDALGMLLSQIATRVPGAEKTPLSEL